MPADVRRAVQGRESDAGATVNVLMHLLDAESHYRLQLRRVAAGELETWSVLDCDLASPLVVKERAESLVERFETARSETLVFLESLSAGDWQRKTVHEVQGEMSLHFLVQALVDHDTRHLGQLTGLYRGAAEKSAASGAGLNAVETSSLQNRQDSEVKNERKRTRKWPRRRIRRGH